MRGKRTMEGIYFKAKDVGRVFESDSLVKTILDERKSYHESVGFVCFTLKKGGGGDNDTSLHAQKQAYHSSQEVFLTFQGLIKACFLSQTLRCNKSHGEIYLISLGNRLYKFGKSCQVDQRVKVHEGYFGGAGYGNVDRVHCAKVDIEKLSYAETTVKNFLQTKGWYRSTQLSSELCELNDNDLEEVKQFYDQLQARYFSGVPYSPPIDIWKLLSRLFRALHVDEEGDSLQSDPDQGYPRDSDTSLQEHDHPSPQEQKRTYHNSHEVFLTFAGLMHALHSTRSPVANEFRDWVYKKVFALAYGTVEQKQEMLSTLCKVDKSFLQAFMKLIPNDLACLYLVDTTMRGDGKKVFKFGRSEKVKERFYKHSSAFGDGVILDTVIFVPSDYLSEAETLLKEALREDDHFTFNKEQELILLDTESYKSVRSIMQTIADKYNGSMAIQAEVHTREIKEQEHKYKLHAKDSEHEYKLRIKDLESMIEVLKERIQNAVADEKAKATVLLSKLEQRLAARDIQLIEEKGKVSMLQQEMTNKVSMIQQEMTNKVSMIQQQSTSKLENMELRQKIAAIEHAAEIKEKDRLNGELRARIHELEETNRRLSKNFPEAA
ncbi:Uncharacterized protein P3T76_015594 [Phytophthora citrophthora]|uniref:Uncharacterized protein n=1 Tax=Phytophthora citrophthora TaxID=4793 RepID=A0AAD9FZ57_9STRA|nr:Uncharacterized protein P3T76_015594 [Phytophthora citrophthora]